MTAGGPSGSGADKSGDPPGSSADPAPAAIEIDPALRARVAGKATGAPTWKRALFWLWVGQVISHFGDSLFTVGIFFLALRVTGSKAQSGLLLALNFLPALGIGLFAGAFVDRHDRRRVLLVADIVRTLAVASIPVLAQVDLLSPFALGLAMFALATGSAFFNPAMKAIIPELVPPAHLTTTATLFQLSEYAALGLGPALAGLVIIPELGSIHLFTFDAATFAVSTLCVLALAPVARKTAHTPAPLRLMRQPGVRPAGGMVAETMGGIVPGTIGGIVAETMTGIAAETMQGLRVVLATPAMRALLTFVAIDNLLLAGLTQVGTPLLVKERLGLDTDAFARVQSCLFLGMLVASAALWAFARRLRKGTTILLGILLDGLTLVPLAFCRSLPEVGIALFVHAFAIPLIIIPRTVLIQQHVPGPLHGRAFALINVTVFGMTAISAGATGALAEVVAPQQLFLALGLAGALAGLAGFAVPSLRRAR